MPAGREPDISTVLFACVHNAGRSQMAAAFFNALSDPARARAISAGTEPSRHVHSEVVAAMREVGIDLGDALPRHLTAGLASQVTLLVTMGCGEVCPVVPGLAREDWDLPDPKGQPPERVRAIRDLVRERVVSLLTSRGWRRRRENVSAARGSDRDRSRSGSPPGRPPR